MPACRERISALTQRIATGRGPPHSRHPLPLTSYAAQYQ